MLGRGPSAAKQVPYGGLPTDPTHWRQPDMKEQAEWEAMRAAAPPPAGLRRMVLPPGQLPPIIPMPQNIGGYNVRTREHPGTRMARMLAHHPLQQEVRAMDDSNLLKSYQGGGVVTPTGVPQGAVPPPGGGASQGAGLNTGGGVPPMSPQQMELEVKRIVRDHPEQVMQIKQAITQGVQSGELTPQELDMAVQLATAAAQDPQLYPQIRKFAIDQGLATEQDIPMQYDQGLVFVLMLAARAAQQTDGGPAMPQSQGQPPQATMAFGGGPLTSRNADGSVPINAHEGEMVLHSGVVKAKGTEFFDKFNNGYELDGRAKSKT